MSLIRTFLHIMVPVGPVLRAEAGDTLQVMFMNKADRSYSIQSHGFQYNKPFEGVFYQDGETFFTPSGYFMSIKRFVLSQRTKHL